MPFTANQIRQATASQDRAAQDSSDQVLLISGPGTGKTATIEKRVAHLLNNGANPEKLFVISFTKATCRDLKERVIKHCQGQPCSEMAENVQISTMHSLAFRLLRSAGVLAAEYPNDPFVLDDWEQENLYDQELAIALGCTPTRARKIRRAYDSMWDTLDPQAIAEPPITDQEKNRFNSFFTSRKHFYSCVLPGQIVFDIVKLLQQEAISTEDLPKIKNLIVDEYQDLNACDQEFIRLLHQLGKTLFVSGDDDQSIYLFRNANPGGIVNFAQTYPQTSFHNLQDCFRCTPAILSKAAKLISYNPNRINKQLHSLYSNSSPPVNGILQVWSFPSVDQEISALAQSCQQLIESGMEGQEDEIVILISDRRLQLNRITQELGNLGIGFDSPVNQHLKDEPPIRAVHSLLRIVRDKIQNRPDYVALWTLLTLLRGIGVRTIKAIADKCIENNQNFRELFDLPDLPDWFTQRETAALERARSVISRVQGWTLESSLNEKKEEISEILSSIIFSGSSNLVEVLSFWNVLKENLPQEITLEELSNYIAEDDENLQRKVLEKVKLRIDPAFQDENGVKKGIRILTMHGAKGLSGKIVFIPSMEQGILPKKKAMRATGLLNEQRRLAYVSITRAKAVCIMSHSASHTGAEAFQLANVWEARLPRSQFLTEMGVRSINRETGLTSDEARAIIADVNNL